MAKLGRQRSCRSAAQATQGKWAISGICPRVLRASLALECGPQIASAPGGLPKLGSFLSFSGGILWKASLVLLDWLERNQTAALKGKRVLELGSGEGHLAIELCRMGAHVTATEQVRWP
jgi:2-polyprenyl-3-methyl-5-hydroxy-6-metoxy-1,4-benzoquinol methylase